MRTAPAPGPDLLVRRFTPLRLVAERLATSTVPADAFFDPDDFMLVTWCRRDRAPGVDVFTHVDTRRSLNLDPDGVPYRHVPEAAPGAGRYERHRTLRAAVDALGLWELPWLRPDLATHRRGLSWDRRFELRAVLADDPSGRAC
jgi:hypothetical protein